MRQPGLRHEKPPPRSAARLAGVGGWRWGRRAPWAHRGGRSVSCACPPRAGPRTPPRAGGLCSPASRRRPAPARRADGRLPGERPRLRRGSWRSSPTVDAGPRLGCPHRGLARSPPIPQGKGGRRARPRTSPRPPQPGTVAVGRLANGSDELTGLWKPQALSVELPSPPPAAEGGGAETAGIAGLIDIDKLKDVKRTRSANGRGRRPDRGGGGRASGRRPGARDRGSRPPRRGQFRRGGARRATERADARRDRGGRILGRLPPTRSWRRATRSHPSSRSAPAARDGRRTPTGCAATATSRSINAKGHGARPVRGLSPEPIDRHPVRASSRSRNVGRFLEEDRVEPRYMPVVRLSDRLFWRLRGARALREGRRDVLAGASNGSRRCSIRGIGHALRTAHARGRSPATSPASAARGLGFDKIGLKRELATSGAATSR